MSYPSTITPNLYYGSSLGNVPGQYAFEFGGYQYWFGCEDGFGAVLPDSPDQNFHAYQSADGGATWIELDAADVPQLGPPNYMDQASMILDGTQVVMLWITIPLHGTAADISGWGICTFDLLTGLWGTPAYFSSPLPYANNVYYTPGYTTNPVGPGWFLPFQLILRGPNDYLVYYLGPNESLTDAHTGAPICDRLYYATLSYDAGTSSWVFGTPVELAGQAGNPYSYVLNDAICDSFGFTYFSYSADDSAFDFGLSGIYVLVMDPSGTFGTAVQATPSGSYWTGVPYMIASRLMLIQDGTLERIAMAMPVNTGVSYPFGGDYSELHLFYSPVGIGPSWNDVLITNDPILGFAWGNITNFIPMQMSIRIGCQNGVITAVWAVVPADNALPLNTGLPYDPSHPTSVGTVYAAYYSQAPISTMAFSTPALLAASPDFSYPSGVAGELGCPQQCYLYPTSVGIGIVLAWCDGYGDEIAQFFILSDCLCPPAAKSNYGYVG